VRKFKENVLEKKCITLQTDFGLILVLTIDSNTLCTTDIEQCKIVTIGVAWVVAASFVLWTVRSEFMTNI